MNSRTSQDQTADLRHDRVAAPLWLRFMMPSITDLLFVLLLSTLSCSALASRLLGDAGIGWHIRNGQQMLSTGAIPRVDSFSAAMTGHPWFAWEWLYDVGIAAVHQVAGLNGTVFVTAFLIALTFALMFRLVILQGSSLPLALVLTLLAISASMIHMLARPHVISWIFAVIWFQCLDSAELAATPRWSRLILLPFMMLAWVNLHGGFLFGFVLLAIYLVGGVISYWQSSDPEKRRLATWLRHLFAITALSMLASFANPYGYRLHVHIYQYLSNRFLMNHIEEFRSPDFHGIAQECFAVLLIIAMIALASRRDKLRPSQLLLLLFAVYSGLFASRNLPISSILLVLVTAPLLSQAVMDVDTDSDLPPRIRACLINYRSFATRMIRLEFGFRGHLWPAAAILLGIVVCAQQGRLGSRQLIDARFDSRRFPVRATDFLIQQRVSEPIFSLDSWGGYLIYRLYPQSKPFVDDRHDLYGENFLREYLRAIQLAPGWDRVLDEHHVNRVLMPTEASLSNMLRQTDHWEIEYEDGVSVLFKRRP